MSNLLKHAEREMKLIGLDKPDSSYGGKLYPAIMKMMEGFAAEGHSGNSAFMVLEIFGRLARFKTLSPLTNDPEEWMDVSNMSAPAAAPLFQNLRDPSIFSTDGGKTYYSVEDKSRTIMESVQKK